MSQSNDSDNLVLERFRPELRRMARQDLDPALRGKVDPSDLVQHTLMEAVGNRDQFRGHTKAEMAAWLRQILARNLADAKKAFVAAKRDVRRERPQQAKCDESSRRSQAWLAADQTTPSQAAIRGEDCRNLDQALAQLPDLQRRAIVLRHLQGGSLADVARQLEKTEAAVAGLLHRGLKKLHELLHDTE